jgi:hypothetical protein
MMPVRVRKGKRGYRVTDAGRTTAKHTTKAKAKRQANLLRAVSHGWKPAGRRARR